LIKNEGVLARGYRERGFWCWCRRPRFASYSIPQEREAGEEMEKFHFGKLSVNSPQAATQVQIRISNIKIRNNVEIRMSKMTKS